MARHNGGDASKKLLGSGGWWLRIAILLLSTNLLLPALFGSLVLGATENEINIAIQRGLKWLASSQNPTTGIFGSGYYLSNTAAAVQAMENEGHFPGVGNTYSENVEKGLDYIFTRCFKRGISAQRPGNPDSNANGLGIYFSYNSPMYEIGLVIPAIVASNTPNRVVATGNCVGMTYQEVVQDAVDYIAWAQNDRVGCSGRGGWHYQPNLCYGDNSVAQWPVLALVAAEQWGIMAPQFVKEELNFWLNYIQNSNGGSGYTHPNNYVNVAKTGGLMVQQYYFGDTSTSARAIRAKTYIDSRWHVGPSHTWYGNKGHPYAMFAVFKGLELMNVHRLPSAPANEDTEDEDWWGDYAEYLVLRQIPSSTDPSVEGYWNGYEIWRQHLATPWYIMILQATVFPISINVNAPDIACDNDVRIDIHYSVERFPATGSITVYHDGTQYGDAVSLVDFQGSATETITLTAESIGIHSWKAELEVTGGGISASTEDEDVVEVVSTPLVQGIPDQFMPFQSIPLDNFVTCNCVTDCPSIEWVMDTLLPAGWTVFIDPSTHVATVTAPDGAVDPVDITFKAIMDYGGIICTGDDTATFTPNQPPVADAGKEYPNEYYHVCSGDTITLDGTGSYDPDPGDTITLEWDFDQDGNFDDEIGSEPVFSAAGLSGGYEVYLHLRVCDSHGACDINLSELKVYTCSLALDDQTNELGSDQSHSVTATVSGHRTLPEDSSVEVEFEVTGTNALTATQMMCDPLDCHIYDDESNTGVSDGFGSADFTYEVPLHPDSLGTDEINVIFHFPDENNFRRTVTKHWVDTTPPTAYCIRGTNPGGNKPPAGKKKKPKNSRGHNPPGWLEIGGTDDVSGSDAKIYGLDEESLTEYPVQNVFGKPYFTSPSNIKYTQAPGRIPGEEEEDGWCHVWGQGDFSVFAVDDAGNVSDLVQCPLVPPD